MDYFSAKSFFCLKVPAWRVGSTNFSLCKCDTPDHQNLSVMLLKLFILLNLVYSIGPSCTTTTRSTDLEKNVQYERKRINTDFKHCVPQRWPWVMLLLPRLSSKWLVRPCCTLVFGSRRCNPRLLAAPPAFHWKQRSRSPPQCHS